MAKHDDGKTQAGAEDSATELKKGMQVQLVGLQAKPELNGLSGRLLEYESSKQRWIVRMNTSETPLQIKSQHLIAI